MASFSPPTQLSKVLLLALTAPPASIAFAFANTRMHTLLKATMPSNGPGPSCNAHLIYRGVGSKDCNQCVHNINHTHTCPLPRSRKKTFDSYWRVKMKRGNYQEGHKKSNNNMLFITRTLITEIYCLKNVISKFYTCWTLKDWFTMINQKAFFT